MLTLSAGLSGWCECVRVRQSQALQNGEKEVKGELIVFVQKIDFHRLVSPSAPPMKNLTLPLRAGKHQPEPVDSSTTYSQIHNKHTREFLRGIVSAKVPLNKIRVLWL